MVAAAIFLWFSWFVITALVIWFLLGNVASWKSSFFTVSPIWRDDGIFEGRYVRRVTMSDAAWVRKLSIVMIGNWIVWGIDTSMLLIISVLVDGR